MSEVQSLIAEAKDLLAKAEKDVTEAVDETQLRIAVSRLHLFVEHIAGVRERVAEVEAKGEDEPESVEPAADDELEALTRKDLNAKAADLGVEAPDKLPNKDAVIDAIRGATAEPGESDEPEAEE